MFLESICDGVLKLLRVESEVEIERRVSRLLLNQKQNII